jgi:hypothetical protein
MLDVIHSWYAMLAMHILPLCHTDQPSEQRSAEVLSARGGATFTPAQPAQLLLSIGW